MVRAFWLLIGLVTLFGCNNLSEQSTWTYYRVNESIVASTQSVNNQAERNLAMLESASIKDSLRYTKWLAAAVTVKEHTDSTVVLLRKIQAKFIDRSGGWIDSSSQSTDWNNGLGELSVPTNTDATFRFFVTDKQGDRVFEMLEQFEDSVFTWLNEPYLAESLERQLPLSKMLASDSLPGDWSTKHFAKLSSVEALVQLNKCVLDVRLAESILLDYILSQAARK
jgi:hypothetical protein